MRSGLLPGPDIVRPLERCVDPPSPGASVECRQLEFQRLPVPVDDQVHLQPGTPYLGTQRETMRVRTPVGVIQPDTMPPLGGLMKKVRQAYPLLLDGRIAQHAPRDEVPRETMDVAVNP